MKKKGKRKPKIPPLSALDKLVYGAAIVLHIVIAYGFAVLYEAAEARIAAGNPAVIAFSSHSSSLLVVPFFAYVFISVLILLISNRASKTPIFGNKKITYGTEPWDRSSYPLFSAERKRRYIKPSQRETRRKGFAVWCVGCIITLVMLPLGLFGRSCLLDNHSIVDYNVFNKAVTEYTAEDYKALTLKTKYAVGYRSSPRWLYTMTIEMENGEKFTFSNEDFITRNNAEKLEKISEIKACFSDDGITVTGADDVDKLAEYLHLTDNEAQMLSQLFSTD